MGDSYAKANARKSTTRLNAKAGHLRKELQDVQVEISRRRRGWLSAESVLRRIERAGLLSLLAEVCATSTVQPIDVAGRRRFAHVTRVRHLFWWRCREEFGLSLPVLGEITDRDHTTILSGLREHEMAIQKEPGGEAPGRT